MATLERIVRLCVNPGQFRPQDESCAQSGFAGYPTLQGLGRYFEFVVRVEGEPDSRTGYLVNIKDIDHAVRLEILPRIHTACEREPASDPFNLLRDCFDRLSRVMAVPIASLEWRLTPYYSIAMSTPNPGHALIKQRFDFSAAHRLHVPEMSQQENVKVFGKCNNLNGHGHNYQVEPRVAVKLDSTGKFGLQQLEQVTRETIIERFDHKHLNLDTPEFGPQGLNPSVENIARVCFELLSPEVDRMGRGSARLESVTVWETDRTSATYPA